MRGEGVDLLLKDVEVVERLELREPLLRFVAQPVANGDQFSATLAASADGKPRKTLSSSWRLKSGASRWWTT